MEFIGIVLLLASGVGVALYLKQQKSGTSAVAQPLSAANPGAALSGSGIGTAYDAVIAAVADRENVDPVLLKAIVAKESYFDEEAVNPESTFTLYGVTYSPSDPTGIGKLRTFISNGGDPYTIGVNPSLGLAQVRVSTGKSFIPGLDANELFDPTTNLTASARLLRQLLDAGITLDTIDAYNVGQDLSPRNLSYRDAVNQWYAKFQGDFPNG